MDYVPLPLNPLPPGMLFVPLLSRIPYDVAIAFADYPEHQGWGRKTISQWYRIFETPTRELQAFLQRWLLFAPLQAFGGFLPETSEPSLELQMLPRLAKQWLDYSAEDLETRLASCVPILEASWEVHQILSTPDPSEGAGWYTDDTRQYTLQEFMHAPGRKDPCHPRVSIAISSMLDFCKSTIICAGMNTTGQGISDTARLGHSGVFQWRSPIWTEMIQRNWCPFELAPMSVRFNTAGLAFMSLTDRPYPLRRHEIAADYPRPGNCWPENPHLCSSFNCVHRRLQDATYSTVHAPGCPQCRCPTVVARIEDLSPILLAGSFPLIKCVDDGEGEPRISLVPWQPQVTYVAISHVWSDGLGNVNENGIPKCQLLRLSKFVRNLPIQASHFWLDTICVPPDKICKPGTLEQELQDRAIARMRDTYYCSTATLVLDAWLLSRRCAGMTDTEKMMRVFGCTWNSRLWTYQEGALPPALYFQFEDTAVNLDEMKTRLETEIESDLALRFTLGERLIYQHHSLRGFKGFDGQSEDFVLYILGNMAFRSTSVATDEALCLSTLMGLSMDEMLRIEPEQRMAEFWRKVPCAPSSLLLASVPTLDDPGLSWAPYSSLLVRERLSETGSLNTLPNISLRRPTTLTERGLNIIGAGLLIFCGGYRPEDNFLVRDDCGFIYHVRTVLHKIVATEAFQEAVGVPVVHSHDKVHHCVENDGVLQPLLLMQPHEDGMMIGRKIGVAVIRCVVPNQDTEIMQKMANYDIDRDGVIGDNATQKLLITMGRNILSETWCVA